jgi:methanethiol S-methyltransferase
MTTDDSAAGARLGLIYAGLAYTTFLAVLVYTLGFLAGAGTPTAVDKGPHWGWLAATLTDLVLLSLFAIQHSVMARPWFKRAWTRLVPPSVERATYVLAASLALALLMWLWRPIRGSFWSISGSAAVLPDAGYALGWLVVVGSTFMINHFDLFGLRQAWLRARGMRYSSLPFTERGLYSLIRHPLMAGFLIVLWATPRMTTGHLLFAAVATAYILVGISFEERDLTRDLGATYASYRGRVPALIPGLGHLTVTTQGRRHERQPGAQGGHVPHDGLDGLRRTHRA